MRCERRHPASRRIRAVGPALALALVLAVGAQCRPVLDDRPWLITTQQIIAWKAEPPEARPGSDVTLQIVALDPAGPPDTAATAWTLCHAPKPLDEGRVVASACLAPTTPAAAPDAAGDPTQIAIPTDACRIFGPDTPQPAPGAPATRPRDPDATGGYFQPLTIALGASLAVGLVRVTCDLPDASLAIARAFQAAYQPNRNPTIAALTFTLDDGTTVDPSAVSSGARINVEARWAPGDAETFPLFDRASDTLVDAHETLTASWYTTGGTVDRPATQIADPTVLSARTGWTAPPNAGSVEIAIILRDSRGGSDVARAVLNVAASKP